MSELSPESIQLLASVRHAEEAMPVPQEQIYASLMARLAVPPSGPLAAGRTTAGGQTAFAGGAMTKVLVGATILAGIGAVAIVRSSRARHDLIAEPAIRAARPTIPSQPPGVAGLPPPALPIAIPGTKEKRRSERSPVAEPSHLHVESTPRLPSSEEPLETPLPSAVRAEPTDPIRETPRPTATDEAAPLAKPTPTCTLADELGLIRQAQLALRDEDGERALESLAEHRSRCPRGTLRDERRVAQVLALCQSGRGAEARAAASQFREDSPNSPLLSRLRSSCAKEALAP